MGERDWGEEAKKLVVNSIQGSNRSLRMTALEALQGATLDDDRWKVLLPIIITVRIAFQSNPSRLHVYTYLDQAWAC